MERLGKKDKAVIRAFTERRAMQGHKLDTDGKRIDIVGLGGADIAHWKDGKIHFPGNHGSRSGQLVERAIAREAPKNDLYNGRGYNPTSGKKYRAIKWRRSSDDTTPVGQWHSARSEALRDAYADYAPHRSATYEIEDSDGGRKELTESQYERAQQWYAGAMSDRDAKGVWGNPARVKNTHNASQSAHRFVSAVTASENAAIEAASRGDRGDVVGMLDALVDASYWLGVATAEKRYLGGEKMSNVWMERHDALTKGEPSWGRSVATYMIEVMGVQMPAANPKRGRRRNPSVKAKSVAAKNPRTAKTKNPKRRRRRT